jgi:acetolactate synthase I/II/III large subunit
MKSRIGGHIVVDQLIIQGVNLAFGVPGESYLAVLDGLYENQDQIKFVVCRHEGGAAVMAEAYAKLTGRTGVCMVTRGPGATNAAIGVHTAMQDSTPMVLFIGQVGSDFADREAFQEVDYKQMFGPLAKWVAQIDDVERIPEYIARAFQVAQNGRPGPVVLALPETTLSAAAIVADLAKVQACQAQVSLDQIDQIKAMLSQAKRPFLLLGGFGWTPQGCTAIAQFAQNNYLPIGCAFRFQDLLDNHHSNYVGDVGIAINPALATRIEQADLIIAIGPRLGEITTSGYSLITAPKPAQKLIHVHSGAEELGSVYQADLLINASPNALALALANVRVESSSWQSEVVKARQAYEAWQREPAFLAKGKHDLNLWKIIQICAEVLPRDTIVTNGAGNFATWAHRFWRYGGLRTQLAPTSGAMGYGVPAGIAAQIIAPDRCVLTVAGDGDFQMTGQELATAVQYGAAPIIIVFNNGIYGTIRMHQNKQFPNRVSGTEMFNPDFVMLAKAYGCWSALVEKTDEFESTLKQAFAFTKQQQKPALIELKMDPLMLTTRG